MKPTILALTLLLTGLGFADTAEIKVNLKLDNGDYVVGERVRGVIDVANASADTLSVGYEHSDDRLFVEVYRKDDSAELERTGERPFVSPFLVKSNEGQKLETFLADHFGLKEPGHFLAVPVLVHDGVRFVGQPRAFDVVPGMEVASALQMFRNHEGLRREFRLLTWSRDRREHLFLAAQDTGSGSKGYVTTDLGQTMRVTKPTISVLPGGEVIVLHRCDSDHFLRTEFWSMSGVLEFHGQELVQDPETAGQHRVREMYKEKGGVEPISRPWWKFW